MSYKHFIERMTNFYMTIPPTQPSIHLSPVLTIQLPIPLLKCYFLCAQQQKTNCPLTMCLPEYPLNECWVLYRCTLIRSYNLVIFLSRIFFFVFKPNFSQELVMSKGKLWLAYIYIDNK